MRTPSASTRCRVRFAPFAIAGGPIIWKASRRLQLNSPTSSAAALAATAYPPAWRALAAFLLALGSASLPVILLLVFAATDPPVTPPLLVRLVLVYAALPTVAVLVLRRAFRAEVSVGTEDVVIRRSRLAIEIPTAAIAHVKPWMVPLPAAGLSLVLRSGRRLPVGLGLADPGRLLEALAERGGVAAARAALTHPTVVWATARHAVGRRRWYHLAAKFPLFALLPTAVLFNAHQHIAHGGTFGEYYLLGLGAYLRTFAVYWTTVTIYLVLWASAWRGVAEAMTLAAAAVAPSRAARVRRLAEWMCRLLYFGGVPVVLVLRFLPW
jgi:hypothetical protein